MPTTDTITRCHDCDQEAVVGWSHSPDYPPPVWLCHHHFQARLETVDIPVRVVAP
jgi:hypothetical protein